MAPIVGSQGWGYHSPQGATAGGHLLWAPGAGPRGACEVRPSSRQWTVLGTRGGGPAQMTLQVHVELGKWGSSSALSRQVSGAQIEWRCCWSLAAGGPEGCRKPGRAHTGCVFTAKATQLDVAGLAELRPAAAMLVVSRGPWKSGVWLAALRPGGESGVGSDPGPGPPVAPRNQRVAEGSPGSRSWARMGPRGSPAPS